MDNRDAYRPVDLAHKITNSDFSTTMMKRSKSDGRFSRKDKHAETTRNRIIGEQFKNSMLETRIGNMIKSKSQVRI